jgi:hypothetical protein
MTATADRTGPGRSREELRLVELASGLLLLLDAHRLTGRLPLAVQIQASRLRHAVKLAIQAEAARTNGLPPTPPPATSRDQAAALRAWIATQPLVQPGPQGWVYLTLFWSSTGRVVLPAGWGDRQQDVVDLAGDGAFEFPESSSGGEPPFCAVPGGVVDRVVVPAGPDDPQPGPSENADGVGMVLAAAAGVGVDLGRPG